VSGRCAGAVYIGDAVGGAGGITPKTKRKYFSQQIISIVFLPRHSQISENWRRMILEERWINCWMNFSYDEMDPYCDHGTGFKRENARGGALIYQDCPPLHNPINKIQPCEIKFNKEQN